MGLEDLENLPELTFMQTRMVGLNKEVAKAKITLHPTEPQLPEIDEGPYEIFGIHQSFEGPFLIYKTKDQNLKDMPWATKIEWISNYEIIK